MSKMEQNIMSISNIFLIVAVTSDPYREMYADPHAIRMRREQQGVASKTYLVEVSNKTICP